MGEILPRASPSVTALRVIAWLADFALSSILSTNSVDRRPADFKLFFRYEQSHQDFPKMAVDLLPFHSRNISY